MIFLENQISKEIKNDLRLCNDKINLILDMSKCNKEIQKAFSLINENSGKRIRPLLTLLSGGFSKSYNENKYSVIDASAIIELIHTASLVHDDIVDNSSLRRGKPTIQYLYGKESAVYIGDLILANIMEFSLKCNHRAVGLKVSDTIKKMCLGELIQNQNLFNLEMTFKSYWDIIDGKTSALFEASCYCGALEGGCDEELSKLLSDIGIIIGRIFQIRDDLLDFGVMDINKPTFQDFKNGIFTPPILYSLKNKKARYEIKNALLYIKSGDIDTGKLLVNKALEESQGIEKTLKMLNNFSKIAERKINLLPNSPQKAVFIELINFLGRELVMC